MAGQSSDGYGYVGCLSSLATRDLVALISRLVRCLDSSSASQPAAMSSARRRRASTERRGSALPRHCQSTVRSLYSSAKQTPWSQP